MQLSEDPEVSVLLIEAGESDQRQLMSKIPAGWVRTLTARRQEELMRLFGRRATSGSEWSCGAVGAEES